RYSRDWSSDVCSSDLAERKVQEEAAGKTPDTSNGNEESNEEVVTTPPVSSGLFMRPAQGYVSSEFDHRWGAFHYGIDIAKGGTVPIVAAAGGIVTRAGWSNSYGNVVYISHYLDGKTFMTVYAHMRETPKVVVGQMVSKGQHIGYMGNTG